MNGIPISSTRVPGRPKVDMAQNQRTAIWRKPWRFALALATLTLLSGCAGSFDIQKSQTVTGHRVVQIMQEGSGGDRAVRAAISAELMQRGFRLAESGAGSDVLKLGYSEAWSWDYAIHLRALHLQLVDARTGEVFAVARYDAGIWQDFPGPQSVVRTLFEKWDTAGVFQE